MESVAEFTFLESHDFIIILTEKQIQTIHQSHVLFGVRVISGTFSRAIHDFLLRIILLLQDI